MIVNTNICIVLNHGPDTTLSTYINSYNLHINYEAGNYNYSHFTDEEREAQIGQISCPSSYS